jgi:hypothetical protein
VVTSSLIGHLSKIARKVNSTVTLKRKASPFVLDDSLAKNPFSLARSVARNSPVTPLKTTEEGPGSDLVEIEDLEDVPARGILRTPGKAIPIEIPSSPLLASYDIHFRLCFYLNKKLVATPQTSKQERSAFNLCNIEKAFETALQTHIEPLEPSPESLLI